MWDIQLNILIIELDDNIIAANQKFNSTDYVKNMTFCMILIAGAVQKV